MFSVEEMFDALLSLPDPYIENQYKPTIFMPFNTDNMIKETIKFLKNESLRLDKSNSNIYQNILNSNNKKRIAQWQLRIKNNKERINSLDQEIKSLSLLLKWIPKSEKIEHMRVRNLSIGESIEDFFFSGSDMKSYEGLIVKARAGGK
jgi:hypothetical protein